MAEAGLFIGWGAPVTGREAKGLEVFAEALAYYATAEQDGRIESHETLGFRVPADGRGSRVTVTPPAQPQCRAV